ncbi:structural maintenance of chromosomes protein 5 [Electrophorus electricus]|uniref:Structural maintenance of chromosomes protein 5 n=1 Tax=Electrophorus electricus TaxID=8005 RepID=A0A4W4FGI8_ELEEL|nr:structural maintenance of chromosomes protein 5 [Electrophorus electricus]
MALHCKRKRISHELTTSQTANSQTTLSSFTNSNTFNLGNGLRERFVKGSILRISMKNFLTYDHSDVFPGPNLNMIVGANGTGKSSIVCAICLGLAGKTAILGRGDKVGLYVKRGCAKGSVEIELYRAGGNLVINREIHVENNQSVWMINSKHASQKAVEETVKELQIQVGNLCQFLPQEKVGEFAKMSKIELLEATEKSVGPPEMYEFHCKLKTFRTKERELENSCKEKANFLEKARQRNERNKLDVERYHTKRRHLDRIQMLEKKKPWVEYETARKELEEVKKQREEMKKTVKSLKEVQAPLLRKIQNVESQLMPIENGMKEKTAKIRETSQKCKQKQDQLDRKYKEIDDIKQALSLQQTEEADRKKRIANTRRLIQDLQRDLDSLSSHADVTPRIEAVNAELRTIQEEKAQLDGEGQDLQRDKDEAVGELRRLQNRKRSMEDMMNRKEEKLRNRFCDTYAALQWLKNHRDLFEGKVYEPMMLVINVRDPRNAKYIESHIPVNDLRAFVFEKQQDMEKFMAEVRDKQKLRVNSVIAPAESCANRPPSRPLDSLKRFGIVSYLRELFDAPEAVMSYLCYQYRINDVPVGTEKTKSMIEMVIRESQLRMIYTAEEKYTVKKSSYSSKIISSNSALRNSQFLSMTIDADERRKLEEQLNAAQKQVQVFDARIKVNHEQQVRLDRRDNELRAEKKRLSELKGKRRQLEQKISTKEDSVRQMEQSGIDLLKADEEAKVKICAVNDQKVAIVEDFVHAMKLRARLSMEKVYLALEAAGLTAEKISMESDYRERTAELRRAEQVFLELDHKKTSLLETCKNMMRRAREICNMNPGETVVPEILQTAFSELPNTLEDIDAMLSEEKARADCITGLSETVVEEYNRREQEIKTMEKELEEKTNTLTTYRQNISEAKERWLIPLKQLVEQINMKFSDFFRSMHCAGEVDLHSENPEEYDRYGIRIRVKFRSSTQLHELTPHHQSGGERSVSTMLYLMALQELNRCPFRVVDEINQGMDPVNERRVFDIVVKTACNGSTSQYFFITPKLLQNLSYADEMTILCVHNGPYMLPPHEWNEKAFIRRSKYRSIQ